MLFVCADLKHFSPVYVFHSSAEFNSNWGRLLRTMRVRLTPLTQLLARSESNAKARGRGDATKYTHTEDFRVAWGSTEPNLPGM